MITFLCYLALCIFLFLVQFGPPFFGTPINEEKGTRILFAITKKINTWLFDYGFAVFSHRCRFELHSVYLMNLRRFTTSHAKLPFNTNTQTDKPVIPFWWGFLCVGNWFVDIDTAIRKTRVPGVNHLIQKHTMRFLRFLASKDRSRIKRGLNMQNL